MVDLERFAKQQQEVGALAKGVALARIDINDGRGTFALFDTSTRAMVPAETVEASLLRPDPMPRFYTAASLESLIEMVRHFAPAADAAEKPGVHVLVGMGGVTVLLDDEERRDRLRFEFGLSDAWVAVRGLKDESEFTQVELVSLIRSLSGQAVIEPGNLLATVRAVKFSASTDGQSSVGTGKYAESKSTAAELTGAGDLPELVSITAPVWANVKFGEQLVRKSVACAFDADPFTRKFSLPPRAGEVDTAEAEALELVIDRLRQELQTPERPTVRVFAGEVKP